MWKGWCYDWFSVQVVGKTQNRQTKKCDGKLNKQTKVIENKQRCFPLFLLLNSVQTEAMLGTCKYRKLHPITHQSFNPFRLKYKKSKTNTNTIWKDRKLHPRLSIRPLSFSFHKIFPLFCFGLLSSRRPLPVNIGLKHLILCWQKAPPCILLSALYSPLLFLGIVWSGIVPPKSLARTTLLSPQQIRTLKKCPFVLLMHFFCLHTPSPSCGGGGGQGGGGFDLLVHFFSLHLLPFLLSRSNLKMDSVGRYYASSNYQIDLKICMVLRGIACFSRILHELHWSCKSGGVPHFRFHSWNAMLENVGCCPEGLY